MRLIRFFALPLALLVAWGSARADEGMWMVHMLQKLNQADLQRAGFRLTAADIYDINNASIKDAIVRLNGGMCTGEVISGQGLVLTNHHCAYDAIQGFSSVEHDYLTDGFYAKSLGEEMHIEDFVISFLVRVDDVTADMLAGVTPEMDEAAREEAIAANRKKLLETRNPDK